MLTDPLPEPLLELLEPPEPPKLIFWGPAAVRERARLHNRNPRMAEQTKLKQGCIISRLIKLHSFFSLR